MFERFGRNGIVWFGKTIFGWGGSIVKSKSGRIDVKLGSIIGGIGGILKTLETGWMLVDNGRRPLIDGEGRIVRFGGTIIWGKSRRLRCGEVGNVCVWKWR